MEGTFSAPDQHSVSNEYVRRIANCHATLILVNVVTLLKNTISY